MAVCELGDGSLCWLEHTLCFHSQLHAVTCGDTARKRGTQNLGWEQETAFFRGGVKIPALFSSRVPFPNTRAGRTIPYLRERCVVFFFPALILPTSVVSYSQANHLPSSPSSVPDPLRVCNHYMEIYEQSCCSGGAGGLLLLHLTALVTFRESYCPLNNSYYFKWTLPQTQQPN